MVKNNQQYIIGAALVLLGSICFSAKAVMVKLAYRYEIDSVSLMALRMIFSLPFFLLVAFFSNKKSTQKKQLKKRDWALIAVFGMSGFYVASLADFIGLQYITASLERVILFTYPTMVVLIAALFLKRKIKKTEVFALILTYVGTGIALFENFKLPNGDSVLIGSALIFLAALAYAIFVIGSGEMLKKMGTLQYNSLAMTAACMAIILHHAIAYNLALFNFQKEIYILAFIMGLFSTVLASFLVTGGIRMIGASHASIISSIGPISTILLAYIFLGERLSGLQWVGTLIVIFGVLVITLNKRKSFYVHTIFRKNRI